MAKENQKTVLLAVSDRDLSAAIGKTFAGAGFAAEQVADGVQAIAALGTKRFDLFVCDEAITRIAAKEVIRVAKTRENTPVLLLAESAIPTKALWEENEGFNAFLLRPFTAKELISAAERILRYATRGEIDLFPRANGANDAKAVRLNGAAASLSCPAGQVFLTVEEMAFLERACGVKNATSTNESGASTGKNDKSTSESDKTMIRALRQKLEKAGAALLPD